MVVEETAVEERTAGFWLGERVLPADDVGREELAEVWAAIGMSRSEGSHVVLASTLAISVVGGGHSRLGCSGACFPKASQGWGMWLLDGLTYDRWAGQGSKTQDSSWSSWAQKRVSRLHPKPFPARRICDLQV